jgi:hypothetical protein
MNTNVNVVNFPGAPSPKTTLGDLAARLAKIEAQENPDVDVRLADLKAGNDGTIVVPSLGEYSLNNWSRVQIGHSLGLSWDKFFSGASASDCAEDLNRRLGRARGLVRLRTTRAKADDAPGDGTIRAVVSKDFASIKDTMITNLLTDALRTVEPDARVVRTEMTNLSTSFVIKLGEPYKIGGPGNVGEVWGALSIRNSGVGYARLIVNLSLVRLSCLNGMTAPIGLPSIVRARHRWLDEGQIRESVLRGLDGVGERLRRSTRVLGESAERAVDDVDAEVRQVLQNAKLPLRLARPILAAYGREPHASRFGISQAITLHAQFESPELRLTLEDAAGRYLAQG